MTVDTDAKSLSVAGSSVAADASAFAYWNNAAASVFSEKTLAVGAAYGVWQPQFASDNVMSVAGFSKLGDKLSVNAAAKYYMHRPYDMVTDQGVYGGSFTPVELTAGVGVAYKILPVLSASLSANFISSNLGGPKTATAFSADLGVYYKSNNLSAGFVAENLGTRVSYGGAYSYALPSNLALGAAYSLGDGETNNLQFSAQGTMYLAGLDMCVAAGASYSYNNLLRVAAGYNYGLGEFLPSFLSLGVGGSFAGISLDVCYLMGDILANTLMFNLGYAF